MFNMLHMFSDRKKHIIAQSGRVHSGQVSFRSTHLKALKETNDICTLICVYK